MRVRTETQESLEQSFTPSLARRLSRTLIEQQNNESGIGTRSFVRSPSVPRDARCRSPTGETSSFMEADRSVSTVSDQSEYRQQQGATNRGVRRANSLLERSMERLGSARASPRRTLFEKENERDRGNGNGDEDNAGVIDQWYKDAVGKRNANKFRRESFRGYRTGKIQEETADAERVDNNADNGSISECTSASVCDSNTNLLDATSSVSAKSYESLSTESNPSSNLLDYKSSNAYKSAELSRSFENRLLAAENLIKESKLKNLGPAGPASKFDRNLSSSYRDTDKCEKRSLISIEEAASPASALSKRRSCIPSLRLRSGSLTREPSSIADRRKSFADSLDVGFAARSASPEKSLLGKLFKSGSSRENDSKEKEKPQKTKQRRISRFLRPDFFDTPREESQYAKEKEAQKAAENERRKSRFMRRKNENGGAVVARANSLERDKQPEKELKNEINSLKRDSRLSRDSDESFEGKKKPDSPEESSKNGFLHSLEKKLEKLRSNDDQSEEKRPTKTNTTTKNGEGVTASDGTREHSAPPAEQLSSNERTSAKRAVSVEDLSSSASKKKTQNSSKSRVSSVLGLFKSGDAKQPARSQNTILSKLKRSPPKAVKDTSLTEDTVSSTSTSTSASRIPTKLAKCDSKVTKKFVEAKKSNDKTAEKSSDRGKRSPVKEPAKAKENRGRESREKTVDRESEEKNEEKETTSMEVGEKRALVGKTKKTIRSSMENSGSSGVEADKRVKKLAKKPEGTEPDSEGTKKKKIIRVTKKIVKKSTDSGEDKTTEENEKSAKSRVKKKVVGNAENPGESNGADTAVSNGKTKENGTEEAVERTRNERGKSQESQRPNRGSLKLDLSKIPQHSFRNGATKKDSPKSESSKISLDSPKSSGNDTTADKLIDCLSKVTHRASITGNKIVIDKPLRAKDVAELKREVTECAKMIESHAEDRELASKRKETTTDTEATATKEQPAVETKTEPEIKTVVPAIASAEKTKESPLDYASEPFSPMDEPESFDSWSISSTELGHARHDLHSPTSPSRSLYGSIKSDNPDSVIERIRRRSFYSRFNDKRRPSLTAPPPGLNLPTSATLPRKFSFTGHREQRDRDRDRANKYVSPYGLSTVSNSSRRALDRSYSLYGDEGVSFGRNRSLDRSRYSDAGHYVSDLRSPSDHLSSLSCSYDPLRRYLRSPTFDLSSSRSRYHSADFATDHDLPAYRSPPPLLSSLLLTDNHAIDAHPTSSSSSSSLGSSTLPRKYGSTVPVSASASEPKTVQYYEELLAPSCVDYLSTARKSPMSSGPEYLNRCENGYYNGNLESQSSDAKRRPMPERVDRSTDQTRDNGETKCSASTSTEAATIPADDHS